MNSCTCFLIMFVFASLLICSGCIPSSQQRIDDILASIQDASSEKAAFRKLASNFKDYTIVFFDSEGQSLEARDDFERVSYFALRTSTAECKIEPLDKDNIKELLVE